MLNIAQLEKQLAGVEIKPHKGTLPLRDGLRLLAELDAGFKPFLIKYTGIVNKAKRYIPVTPAQLAQLAQFKEMAVHLQRCEEQVIAHYGTDYLTAIHYINNGQNYDIDDYITYLYYSIKFIEDIKEVHRYFAVELLI